MFEKKDRLLGLIKSLKSENQNHSKIIIKKLEEIKGKKEDSYRFKVDMMSVMSTLRSVLYNF